MYKKNVLLNGESVLLQLFTKVVVQLPPFWSLKIRGYRGQYFWEGSYRVSEVSSTMS